MEQQSDSLAPHVTKYKSFCKLFLIILNVCLSSYYFGYTLAYFSTIDFDQIVSIFNITMAKSTAQGLLIGIIPIGGGLGAYSSAYLHKKFSRKNSILFINLLAIFFGLFLMIKNQWTLLFSRLGQGICSGLFSATVPIFINEFSPLELSGILCTLHQLSIAFGVFFAFLFGYIVSLIGQGNPYNYWFIIFGFTLPIIIIQSVILYKIFPYETPKYYLMKNNQQKAKQLLKIIYKEEFVDGILAEKIAMLKQTTHQVENNSNPQQLSEVVNQDSPGEKEIQSKKQVSQKNNQQMTDSSSSSSSKPKKYNKIALIMSIHISVLQQFVGINVVVAYGPKVMALVLSSLKAVIPIIINLIQVLATIATIFLLKRFGRKLILQIGTVVAALSLGLISIGFFIQPPDPQNSTAVSSAFIIIGLIIFMANFGMSLGPIVWVMIPQIVPSSVVPFAVMSNWIAAAITMIFFPILTDKMPNKNPAPLFLFFTFWAIASFFINQRFLPQTRNKSEKQIRQQFDKMVSCC